MKFERQLDRAQAADLVERVEAAIRPARPQAARKCLRRATEQRARQVANGVPEVGAVQDVEELSLETKSDLFGDVKLAMQSKI